MNTVKHKTTLTARITEWHHKSAGNFYSAGAIFDNDGHAVVTIPTAYGSVNSGLTDNLAEVIKCALNALGYAVTIQLAKNLIEGRTYEDSDEVLTLIVDVAPCLKRDLEKLAHTGTEFYDAARAHYRKNYQDGKHPFFNSRLN